MVSPDRENKDMLAALIQKHVKRYPESAFQDVYKLLHQAAFGPGHAIQNPDKALEWIERDLDETGPAGGEPLGESIHPAGERVRLHLRPYAAAGGDLVQLRDAFVRSAVERPGAAERMAGWWETFTQQMETDFDPREMRLFGMACARQGWPAIHHSPAYRQAYRPAYRVLTAPVAAELCHAQAIPFEAI